MVKAVLELSEKGSKKRSYSVESAVNEALDRVIAEYGERLDEDGTDERWRLVGEGEVADVEVHAREEANRGAPVGVQEAAEHEKVEAEVDVEEYAGESRLLEEKLKDELHVSFSSEEGEQERAPPGSRATVVPEVPVKPAIKEEAVEKKKGLVLTGQRKLKPKNK